MLRVYERRSQLSDSSERRDKVRSSNERRTHESSLYQRLGGSAAVGAAVDVFYKKVLSDNTLNHFFATTDMSVLREKQTNFFVMTLGGSDDYSGKDIRAAHANVEGITEAHFDAFMDHLHSTLEEFGIPESEIDEVMTIAVNKHDDVLGL